MRKPINNAVAVASATPTEKAPKADKPTIIYKQVEVLSTNPGTLEGLLQYRHVAGTTGVAQYFAHMPILGLLQCGQLNNGHASNS